nr:MAG TPA: hypothetical protein [Bacteriophage sp.]
MAFNMFPYSNLHELNLDWILAELKDFSGQLDEFRTRLDTIREGILTESKAYTDATIAEKYGEFQQQYNELLTQVDQFQTAVNNTLKGFQDQFDDYKEQTTAEVLSAKAYTDAAIAQNNDYLLEEITKQTIGIKVLNPFTGERVSIQDMIDYLSDFHMENAILINTLVNRNNTVNQMIAYNATCTELAINGATIVVQH